MYRLVLYFLIALIILAFIFSFFNLVPFSPFALAFSTIFISATCYITNEIFARTFESPTNSESYLITALILSLIITPTTSFHSLPFLFWASVLSMSSKYILAFRKKHLFNPAATGVFLTSVTFVGSASWWVGNSVMLVPTILGGLLIIRRIERKELVFGFLAASLITIVGFNISGFNLLDSLPKIFLETPILFFTFVMLTEPLTTPPIKKLQLIYGGLVGLLFAPQIHLGSYYFTPESALLIGNVFSFFISPKGRYILRLKEKKKISSNIYDFIFTPERKIHFKAGQYMEWTLPHKGVDSRGNRRYFTIASSPTEKNIRLGVRIDKECSSYKRALLSLKEGDKIYGEGIMGDFTLNDNDTTILIAGGVGVTPFRSMIKELVDRGVTRDITLVYSVKDKDDVVYKDIFEEGTVAGIKVRIVESSKEGRVTPAIIKDEVPNYKNSTFYLSGPKSMVDSFKETLDKIGVADIKTDYFPGFQND